MQRTEEQIEKMRAIGLRLDRREKVSGTIFDRLGAGARFWRGGECGVWRVR
jgi:hypothetical protein